MNKAKSSSGSASSSMFPVRSAGERTATSLRQGHSARLRRQDRGAEAGTPESIRLCAHGTTAAMDGALAEPVLGGAVHGRGINEVEPRLGLGELEQHRHGSRALDESEPDA